MLFAAFNQRYFRIGDDTGRIGGTIDWNGEFGARAQMKYLIWLWLFIGAGIGAQSVPLFGQGQPQSGQRDLELYESVIRFQIKSWDLAASTFCIRVDGASTDALLTRLNPLPVKAASECKELNGNTPLMRVVDRKTKKNSVIFDVGAIHPVSDTEIQVEGGYVCGSQCMASGMYTLVREAAGWRVTGFKWDVIS